VSRQSRIGYGVLVGIIRRDDAERALALEET